MAAGAIRALVQAQKPLGRTVVGVIPPQWRQGRAYWHWRRFLPDAASWPRERIEAWQLERLRRVVAYATARTEGYRELYRRAGIGADDLRTLADVRHLPTIAKADLQENLEAFSVRRPGRRFTTTGGSTGLPLGFYLMRENRQLEDAFMQAGWAELGWRLGEWSAVLRGGFVGTPARPWALDRFRRHLLLSSYHLTPETLDTYLAVLRERRPRILQAFPSSLALLADLLAESGRAGELSFDLILLASENIYDWQLARFEAAFPGARLFTWYGHSEQAILAPWCRTRRRYHAWPFYGLTEVVADDGRPAAVGVEGELVGTDFHNFATPFIRYRTQDRAVYGGIGCDGCGRAFDMLDRVVGRSQEYIVARGGRRISTASLNLHDAALEPLRQFQFIQERPGEVCYTYVPKRPLDADERRELTAAVAALLGDDVRLEVREVAEIPRTSGGKYRLLDQRLTIESARP